MLTRIFFVALMSILSIYFSLLVLRYGNLISENNQGLSSILWACIVGMPMHVSFFIPIATAIATFFTISILQQQNSLLGAFALGYRRRSLVMQCVAFGLIATAITATFTLFIGPPAARAYYTRLSMLHADRLFIYTEPKKFIKLTDKSTIWMEEKPSEATMLNIVFDMKDKKQEVLIVAQKGRVLRTEKGMMIEVSNGTIWRRQGQKRQILEFEKMLYGVNSLLTSTHGWVRRIQKFWTRSEIPTRTLLARIKKAKSIKHSQKEKISAHHARRELTLRLAFPLLPTVFVALICAICLTPSIRKAPKWRAVIVFAILLIYACIHVAAVILSSKGGLSTTIVFLLSALVFTVALLAIPKQKGK